jgi:hypothetical protein
MILIFVVIVRTGWYEDKDTFVSYAGTDRKKAMEAIANAKQLRELSNLEMETWGNGERIKYEDFYY